MNYFRVILEDTQQVFWDGDRAGVAYLIEEGSIRLHKDVNGTDVEIDTIGPGQIFGELGVISDSNRMATATAVGKTVLTGCHRREIMERVDTLDDEWRDALRFLITYCQDFLPFELMDKRPETSKTKEMDQTAHRFILKASAPDALDVLEPFLQGLYRVLISYAKRRLPPNFEV